MTPITTKGIEIVFNIHGKIKIPIPSGRFIRKNILWIRQANKDCHQPVQPPILYDENNPRISKIKYNMAFCLVILKNSLTIIGFSN